MENINENIKLDNKESVTKQENQTTRKRVRHANPIYDAPIETEEKILLVKGGYMGYLKENEDEQLW